MFYTGIYLQHREHFEALKLKDISGCDEIKLQSFDFLKQMLSWWTTQ